MMLDDIEYFRVKRSEQLPIINLAQKVLDDSMKDPNNATEIQRRLSLLTKSNDAEHIRQCCDFLAEAVAFNELTERGLSPHWVPAANYKTPDISYVVEGMGFPVEVKHINSPRDEYNALYAGEIWGGSVNYNYHEGVIKKIEDFVAETRAKFTEYHRQVNGSAYGYGALYLFFDRSIDATLVDRIEWEEKMEDRIKSYTESIIGDDITLIVMDLNTVLLSYQADVQRTDPKNHLETPRG